MECFKETENMKYILHMTEKNLLDCEIKKENEVMWPASITHTYIDEVIAQADIVTRHPNISFSHVATGHVTSEHSSGHVATGTQEK